MRFSASSNLNNEVNELSMGQTGDELRGIRNPLEVQLQELAEAYREWKFPLEKHADNLAKLGPEYTVDDYWQDYRKIEAELLRVRNLYEEIQCTIEGVCRDYQKGSYTERVQIREVFEKSARYGEFLWMFTTDCVNRIRGPGDEDLIRLAVLAMSIENCSTDYRDTLLILANIYVTAEEKGLAPQPVFDEVAEVTTDRPTPGGCDHLATTLRQFGTYAVVAERRENGPEDN